MRTLLCMRLYTDYNYARAPINCQVIILTVCGRDVETRSSVRYYIIHVLSRSKALPHITALSHKVIRALTLSQSTSSHHSFLSFSSIRVLSHSFQCTPSDHSALTLFLVYSLPSYRILIFSYEFTLIIVLS